MAEVVIGAVGMVDGDGTLLLEDESIERSTGICRYKRG